MRDTYLRDATEEDIDLLFEWANDKSVRANSFSTSRISYEEHKAWYKNLMGNENCRQYIYMCDEEAVGQGRVSISGDTAEVGYSICSEKRGMGHGKNLLQLLKERVRQDFPEIEKLTARVKPDNTASRKAFLDVGYEHKYEFFELDIKKRDYYVVH